MRNISDALAAEARRVRELIVRLTRRSSLRDPIASTCEELDLTPPQIHSILGLGHDGPLTMGDLARRIATTEKTVTGVADRLEKKGYVERERDEKDRRVVRVRLTRTGTEIYRRIDAHIDEKIARFLGLLDAADRNALFRILEKLVLRLPGADGE